MRQTSIRDNIIRRMKSKGLTQKELAERIDVPVAPSYPQYPTPPTSPYPYPYPWWPGIGDYPWWPQVWYTTTSNGKEYENC